jgi:ACS family hexuronate transporter-like MFS transporter
MPPSAYSPNQTADPAPLSSRRAWAIAVASCLTMAVGYLDRQTLAILAPAITADLQISDAAYGWLASAFSFAYLLGPPVAGRWLDRVGVGRGLPIAVTVWSLVAALHAFAPGYAALFVLRTLLGLAQSPANPGANQAVQRSLPQAEWSRALGMVFVGSSIGALAAPLIAGSVSARYGWRPAFIVTALVGMLWVPFWMVVTGTRDARRLLGRRDSGVEEADDPRAGEYLRLLRHPSIVRTVVVILACAPTYAFVLLWGAKYLVTRHEVTQAQIGHYLWLPPLCFNCGALIFGDLASRHAKRSSAGESPRLIFSVAMLLAASCALTPLAGGAWDATFFMGLTSAGVGGLYPLIAKEMLSGVSPSVVSSASGIAAATQSFSFIIATPLIGWSVGYWNSYTPSLVALGCWVLPGCMYWLFHKPRRITSGC